MPRTVNRLSPKVVAALSTPGRHADGAGLYLSISKAGAKSWVFFWTRDGRQREMGLGSVSTTSLAVARAKAEDARRKLGAGLDPLDARRAERGSTTTFGEVADELVESLKPSWRNEKHRDQWISTLRDHAANLRPKPVGSITTADVLAVLKPIWLTKTETASRLRGRIEAVLDAAKARGLRTGENAAAWRGNLDHLLPKRSRLTRGHHEAMAIDEVPGFVMRLRAVGGVSTLALEFVILTATRTRETLGATWGEIDLEAAVWTVPARRMKAGIEHRVPLSPRALEILSAMSTLAPADRAAAPVFPGRARGEGLSDMALLMVARRHEAGCTVHGFRSTFRDWVGERTSFAPELAEHALAHRVGNAVEQAYRRGDALDRRRALMEAWAAFVCSPIRQSNVVTLAAGAAERGDAEDGEPSGAAPVDPGRRSRPLRHRVRAGARDRTDGAHQP